MKILLHPAGRVPRSDFYVIVCRGACMARIIKMSQSLMIRAGYDPVDTFASNGLRVMVTR